MIAWFFLFFCVLFLAEWLDLSLQVSYYGDGGIVYLSGYLASLIGAAPYCVYLGCKGFATSRSLGFGTRLTSFCITPVLVLVAFVIFWHSAMAIIGGSVQPAILLIIWLVAILAAATLGRSVGLSHARQPSGMVDRSHATQDEKQ